MSVYLVHIEHLFCCWDRRSGQELCNVLHLHKEVDTQLYVHVDTKCVQDKLLVTADQITSISLPSSHRSPNHPVVQ